MSELDKLKSAPKAKRKLKGVSFDFSGAEVSYTSASQGGAASGHNDPILLKSGDSVAKELTDEQKDILEAIGEEPTPLNKQAGEDKPSSEGVSKTKDEGNTDMSEELKKEIAELKKALAVQKQTVVVKEYSFSEETAGKVADSLASVDEAHAEVFKAAFDELVAKEAEIKKAAKEEAGEDGAAKLAKAMSKEIGHEEVQKENDEEIDLAAQINKAYKAKQEEAK